jgi:monofunctional biosynthetic peptidoglycan transglycosylase
MKYTRYCFPIVFIIIFFLQLVALAKEAPQSMDNQERLLFDFKNSNRTEDWRIVNDGVMGGLSQSEIVYSDSNTAIFRGTVSLDNNGGFASTRTKPRSLDLDGYDGIQVRVKGDGKTYQFRLRTDDRFDGVSYRYPFATEANAWITIDLPFREFVPVFRGRILDDVEPIMPEDIQQIGFLISNKQAGKFQLEIEWIKAYKK